VGGVFGWTPKGGKPMTVFEAIYLMLTFGALIAIIMSKNTNK